MTKQERNDLIDEMLNELDNLTDKELIKELREFKGDQSLGYAINFRNYIEEKL